MRLLKFLKFDTHDEYLQDSSSDLSWQAQIMKWQKAYSGLSQPMVFQGPAGSVHRVSASYGTHNSIIYNTPRQVGKNALMEYYWNQGAGADRIKWLKVNAA